MKAIMPAKNKVFIATSIDGFIADENDGIDWLEMVPNPEHNDMGYFDFIAGVDAILMGRRSFEKILSFDVDWPYTVPVFVISSKLESIPEALKDKATLIRDSLTNALKFIRGKGLENIYIDGGQLIRSLLDRDMIDSMTITQIPILLGGGIPLFTNLNNRLEFELVSSKVYLDAVVQNTYKRKRQAIQ